MNYVYDVILNLREKYYDFFFWEEDDILTHISKIPIVKVNTKTMIDFLNNNIKVDSQFLSMIKNKTVLYEFNKKSTMPYMCIFTDSKYTLVLEFNYKNESIKRSSLLYEEEEDAINISDKISYTNISYDILNKVDNECYLTRFEEKSHQFVKEKLSKLYKENKEKIKYVYYEIFLEEEKNVDLINKRLMTIVKDNDTNKLNKLNDILILIDAI